MTDTLQTIAENTAATAVLADKFVGFKEPVGKSMTRRWAERDKPVPKEETRTAGEVIDHIRGKLASL